MGVGAECEGSGSAQARHRGGREVSEDRSACEFRRPDIQAAVSHLCADMSRTASAGWRAIERVGMYLKKQSRLVYEYVHEANEELKLKVYFDSQWAGCRATRRSRSGGMLVLGGGLVRSWGNRRGSVAILSGEAEYYVVAKA